MATRCGGDAAITLCESMDVRVSHGRAWKLVGDFAAIALWVPGIEDLRVQTLAGSTVREFRINGHVMRERLLLRSEADQVLSYQLERGALPVSLYLSTLSVHRLGDMQCRVDWSASARGDESAPAARLETLLRRTYRSNLSRLKDLLESGAQLR